MSETPEWALERIKEAKDNQLQDLDLNPGWSEKEKLTQIPAEVLELKQLEVLRLGHNSLTSLPDSITRLQNLTLLDLTKNQLSGLPDPITRLQNLTVLDLSNNQLTTLRDSISRLQSITVLDLSNNRLTTLRDSISRLQSLTSLDLSFNRLESVPDSISRLQSLTSLDLGRNQLSTVPDSITGLRKLTSLDLRGNELTTIPPSITRLQNLTWLDLGEKRLSTVSDSITGLQSLTWLFLGWNELTAVSDSIIRLQNLASLYLGENRLTTVPDSITRLQKLRQLYLNGNPIETPPPGAVGGYDRELGIKEIKKIKRYFRQVKKEGKDYLYEAKLLIVGEAGAGKTSLARKIENMNCELPTEDDTTRGIEVVEWEFPLPKGAPHVKKLGSKDKTFKINIWDFGGQEIYHATHQFFLTKRSLYALVADTRKDDTDFYYWLSVVELLSDSSPLLIVKNEKQDRHREINERQLRGRFTNIKETLATNLATNRGLPEVLREVRYHISKLPHIGTALPKTWVKVREALENNPNNYIRLGEYLKICEENGFKQLKDKLQLSGYLHDLGVCLHFQDDPLLNKIVILKPSWGTEAVYKVLDNETVIGNLGRFNRNDLAKIWHEEKYADMHDELLELMINFKLCYQIPMTDQYIAPQLLTENQPEYDWDESDNLILRYTYEFMPKGIITQFIVVMHRHIADQRCVWRSGVVLTRDQTKAEVVEDYGKREIRIRVLGKDKKELMTIVTWELDKIHGSYRRLKYSKLIPCNCAECKDSQEPHFYKFESLKKRVSDRKFQVECDRSYKMVDVLSLIDDVIDRRRLLEEEKKKGRVLEGTKEQLLYQLLEKGMDYLGESMKQEKVINIGEGVTISAPIVIAETIQDSFKMLAKSEIDDNVKTLLDELLRAVTEVNKKAPQDKAAEAETMARDVEALVKEATSTKPRRKWYQVCLDDLKQVATSVGEIATPVVEIVSKLSPLLLS
jgi:internalin A